MSGSATSAQGLNPSDPEMGRFNGASLDSIVSLSIDPAVFEKLFFNPQTKVHHGLRKTFGVPTPLALVGFNIALSPLAACLMGWRGSDQQAMGAANIAPYFYFGGMLVILSGVLEFVLGNTFSSIVFCGYGAWFLTYGATLQPFYQAAGSYAPLKSANQTLFEAQSSGQLTAQYTSSFGFQVVFMTVLSFIFLICSFRVNLVFVLQILAVTVSFGLISAGLMYESLSIELLGEALSLSKTNPTLANQKVDLGLAAVDFTRKLVYGSGAGFFAAAMLGWYLILAVMLAIIDFPFLIPVFDLSTVIKGKSQREAEKMGKKDT